MKIKVVTHVLLGLLLAVLTSCKTVETKDWGLKIYDMKDSQLAAIANREEFDIFISQWNERKRAYLKKAPEFDLKFTITQAGVPSLWMYSLSGIVESAEKKDGKYFKLYSPMLELYLTKTK